MSILEVITGSLAGILERAAYEVERRTQPRTVEDLRLLSDDVTRAELRHALRRTLDQRDEIARNAEESRRYERERYQAAQTRSDELSATLDRLTAGQKDPLLVELTSELSKRKGENDAWDDGPVETLRRIIGERDDLKQQVSKAGIQLREALDEELQQIDDAMAEAGGERDGDAAAFIAELASELDAIQSVLEANDWLNDGETVVDSVRSLDAARAQLAKLRDEALDKVADIETVNRTLSDASIEMAERIARLEANAGKGGTVLSCVCNHLTRNHVDGTGACETPDCECIEFEPGVRISDGEGGQSAPSVQHEQAYNSQYPVSVTFRCDACKNSSTQTVTVAAVEALQRQLAQYAEHHCSCRVAPRPEPADDGIIRAAEGVVLEPGEYDSIDPTGSSRFRIGAPKWPSSEVGGIWYWRVSTFLPSVTAVRRVEAQPGHVTDDDVARAQHYAHLLRTDSASENPHWDGGHPPPASDIEQACGCDESKRLRERVERTDAKLADLGKERDKQIEKLYEWLNAWQDWAKGVVPQPEMGWHGDHKNRELIEAAFKERDAINLALLGTEFQTGGVPLSAVVRKLMSKSRELKSGNAMLAEQKKQVETLAIKRGEAIEKLTNQLLALAKSAEAS